MNPQEHKEFREAFALFAKKVTSSKEESQRFLIKTGIHDKDGKLSINYQPSAK